MSDQEIIRLYQEGASATKIGKMIGRNSPTVIRILKKNGIKTRGRSEARKLAIKEYGFTGAPKKNIDKLNKILSNGTKTCITCQVEKPLTREFFHFQRDKASGFRSKCIECRRKHHSDNKEEKNKKQRHYYKNVYYPQNRSKVLRHNDKRRVERLNSMPDYANEELIERIYKNCPKGYHVDHMVPIAKGGLHMESNLCYLPAKVNSSKGAKSIEEFGEQTFNENVIYWQDVL